ncbi:MAG: Na/Pi cotransporter family protein, partial [Bdellovibrionales bacterium]|nr:Na/Pi cotransporter family protein [Bdellovibrionales bacterium]
SITGDLIRRMITVATSNRVLAVLVGMAITMLIQSSSISTVMVVGLVNAGLMDLVQAIGVILGANIGTTITGWILAVKVGNYGLLFIGLGIFPVLFSKSDRRVAIGEVVLALGLIFLGLQLMSDAFKPLRTNETFLSYLALFDTSSFVGRIGCVVMGCVLTLIIQSSSAMLGITIALASTGSLTFATAAALVLGENIGTTITALLAALNANVPARRAALSHALFNTTGVVIMMFLFTPFIGLVDSLVPGDPDLLVDGGRPNIAAHIAMGHTLFNVTAVLLMLPFIRQFARLVERLVPAPEGVEEHHLRYLGRPGQQSAEVALNMATMEALAMAKSVMQSLNESERYLHGKEHDESAFKEVGRLEELTDMVQKELTSFVCQVMEGKLNNEQSNRAYFLIRAADELESIADYCHAVCRFRKRLHKNKQDFSQAGWDDVFEYFLRVKRLYTMVSELLTDYDAATAEIVPVFAGSLTEYGDELRERHLERMREGSCKPLPALVFSDLVIAMRRMKNHSVNLFEALEYGRGDQEAPTSFPEVA